MFLAALACGSAVLSGPPAAALAEVKGTYDELYYSQTLDHQDPSNTVGDFPAPPPTLSRIIV